MSGATTARSRAGRLTPTSGGCGRRLAPRPGTWRRSGEWGTVSSPTNHDTHRTVVEAAGRAGFVSPARGTARASLMTALEILLLVLLALAAGMVAWQRSRLRAADVRHQRERAEHRAERQAERVAHDRRTAALFDRMVEGVIVVGPDGRIRMANRAVVALFRFTGPAANRTVLE